MRKLLYIDDEVHNLTTLEVALRKWFKVFTLESPSGALELIGAENITLVITDQRMPVMSGLELAKKINTIYPEVIIIILTAYDDNETMLKAINQGGIYRYLLKPWDVKDLRQTIDSGFETYQLRRRNVTLINSLLNQNNELSAKETRYRLLFESSNDSIIILEENTLKSCNKITTKLFNCSIDFIKGKSLAELSPELQPDGNNSAQKLDAIIQKVLDRKPQSFEWEFKKSGSGSFLASVNINLIEISKTNPVIQVVIRDITEKKKAEEYLRESEENYRTIFENSPMGIAHFNKDGSITRINPPFLKIIGAKEDVKNRSIMDFADPLLKEALEKLFTSREPISYEGTYDNPVTNNPVPVLVRLTPINKKNMEEGLLIIEDQTDKIRQQELTKQIAVARESARFKQNFLANMSHEIRTPLTGVIGMTNMLKETTMNDKQREYISILNQAGEDLREIINQVLDFSKIEAGKISLKTSSFLFKNIPQKAQMLFRSISKKDVAFETETDPSIPEYIVADQVRIMQIINNLISNAVKFTSEGSIKIKSELLHKHKDNQYTIKISISDTGIGISHEAQQLLFTPFTQIEEEADRQYEGTGLGLSICKELARMHGGEIGVESTPGKGSTFWFTFTASKAESLEKDLKVTIPDEEIIKKNLRVLLAEDKRTNQMVLNIFLSSLGFKVTIVSNGEEAINAFEPGKFDLILMDVQMPVMNGIIATQELKIKFKDLPPVIGLSAYALEGDREKHIRLGMDDYLTKPLEKEELIRVLKTFDFI